MANGVLAVQDLYVELSTPRGIVRPLNGFSLEVQKGERFGLVGESGSGKSMAAWAMLGLSKPPARIVGGRVLFRGEDLRTKTEAELRSLRGNELSMITTNPRSHLSPVFRVGEQIARVYATHTGAKRDVAWRKAIEMLRAVGIPDPERRGRAYPHEFSGGMAQRALIATALICSPEVLIADDATNGLDVTVQAQVLDLMADLVRQTNSSVVMITHDLGVVAHYCDSIGIMYAGRVVETASVKDFFKGPIHPYSVNLLDSARAARLGQRAFVMGGPRVDLRAIPAGCALNPRCPLAEERCRVEVPALREVAPDRFVRCHRAEELIRLEIGPGHAGAVTQS